jgi:hypothetical protein
MSATKRSSVRNQLIDCEPNRGIVGGDNGARTRAYDDVDRNVVGDEPLHDAEVTGAAQTSPAEDKANTSWRLRVLAWGAADALPDVGPDPRQPALGCKIGRHTQRNRGSDFEYRARERNSRTL